MRYYREFACFSAVALLGLVGCSGPESSGSVPEAKVQAQSETTGLDLEVWDPGQHTLETRVAAKITNTTSEPIALGRVAVRVWVNSPADETLIASSYGNNQTLYGPNGQWLANVGAPLVEFEDLPSAKDCGGGRQANRVAVVRFADDLEIPAGGYIQTNPWGDSLFAWHRSDWTVMDNSDDYSRISDAGEGLSGRSHLSQFAVYLDDSLVCEGAEGTSSGVEPCEAASCGGGDSGAGDEPTLPGDPSIALVPSEVGPVVTAPNSPEAPDEDAPGCGETPDLDLRVRQIVDADNDKQFRFQVENKDSESVDLKDLSIKLWLAEGVELKTDLYYGGRLVDAAGRATPGAVAVRAESRRFDDTCDLEPGRLARDELEVGSTDQRALAAGSTWTDLLVSVHRSDWSNFAASSDSYSQLPAYQNGAAGDATWPARLGDDARFVLYYKGQRVQELDANGAVSDDSGREPLCIGTCLIDEADEPKINADVKMLLASSVRETAGRGIHSLTPQAEGPAALLLVRTVGGDAALTRASASDINEISEGLYSASVPLVRLPALIADSEVTKVEPSVKLEPLLDTSVADTGVLEVQAPPPTGFGNTGAGVLVGVVDTGIDVNHADFRSGGVSRVESLWDQSACTCTPVGNTAEDVLWNAECTTVCAPVDDESHWNSGSMDTATQRDLDGHGSHVAGTAAGNGEAAAGQYPGVAPDADLAIVNTTFQSAHVLSGVKHIFDSRGTRPSVVNLSLGHHFGPHDGTTDFETGLDALTGPGQIVVAAAGNDQNSPFHISGVATAGAPSTSTYRTVGPGVYRIDLWHDADDDLEIQFTAPTLAQPIVLVDGQTLSLNYTVEGQLFPYSFAAYYGGKNANGNQGIAIIINDGIGYQFSRDATISVGPKASSTGDGAFDAWTTRGTYNNEPLFAPAFSNPSKSTTLGIPATATEVVTVGSYVTRDTWDSEDEGPWSYAQIPNYAPVPIVGDISAFSGRGPTLDGRGKPDLVAPGHGIIAALSADALPSQYRKIANEPYHIIEGTSMAAPHVTGAIALLMQERPDLTPEEAKALLGHAARRDSFTGGSTDFPNHDDTFGYGKLDLFRAAELASELDACDNLVEIENGVVEGFYGFGTGNGMSIRARADIAQGGETILVLGTPEYDGLWKVKRQFMYDGAYTYHVDAEFNGIPDGWGTGGGGPAGSDAHVYLCNREYSPVVEFDGESATEVLTGTDGTLVGAYDTSGVFGSAYLMSGGGDYLSAPDPEMGQVARYNFSLSLWVKTSDTGTVALASKWAEAPAQTGWELGADSGYLNFFMSDGVTSPSGGTSSAFVADGAWHHVALTVERGSYIGIKMFLDGVEVDSFSPRDNFAELENTESIHLGNRADLSFASFDGSIDEFRFFDWTLGQDQIEQEISGN